MLAQMVPADHPDRLISATPRGTSALNTVPADELPGAAPEVQEVRTCRATVHIPRTGSLRLA
ncbi:hypothetical protein AB0C96_07190 [Streptomyces sp. NPDC048506]|uniref:hypothetical protein n=1 Tax=Streptomyces sp. NPDC048506 TaxID=3155028 RepID=UPI00343848CB